jgi:hypothetical protein
MAPNAKRWVEIKPKVGNLPMSVKDAFERFVKIFHGNGAQLVKDSSDFHSIISVGIASILGRNLQPISLLTVLTPLILTKEYATIKVGFYRTWRKCRSTSQGEERDASFQDRCGLLDVSCPSEGVEYSNLLLL